MDFREIGRRIAIASIPSFPSLSHTITPTDLEFATKKSAGSPKGKSCKRGIPCGGSCIAAKKKCRDKLEGKEVTLAAATKTVAEPKSKKEPTKGNKEKKLLPSGTPDPDYYIAKGRDYIESRIGGELQKFKKLDLDELERLESELERAWEREAKASTEEERMKLRKERIKRMEELDKAEEDAKERIKLFANLYEEIIKSQSMSDADVKRIMSTRIHIIPDSLKKEYPDLKMDIEDFIRLTGYKDFERIPIVKRENRANAVVKDNSIYGLNARYLNIGGHPNRTTTFHELGHFYENERPGIVEANKEWIRRRSAEHFGGEARSDKLTNLTGIDYREDEVAYIDKFVHPYVGKIYRDFYTEVFTMGIQSFGSPISMTTLYNEDPEHFELVLGSILP